MVKQKTSFNLDYNLMQELRIKAIDENMTITELLTLYINYGLNNHNQIKLLDNWRKKRK